jgi:hypothetical protein
MAYIFAKGVRHWRKKSKWTKIIKGTTIVSVISILVAAYFGYLNYSLSTQSFALNQENLKLQNYFPSLYSNYGESMLDESITTSDFSLVNILGNVNIDLDISTPHSSIVTINSVSLNFSYGNSMSIIDLALENLSKASFFGRTSYEYTVSPSSPKVSDQIYVAISVYLTPKNYSEYPTTITFPVGELVFKATITDRTNNQTTYTQFTEGIRGQIKFLG